MGKSSRIIRVGSVQPQRCLEVKEGSRRLRGRGDESRGRSYALTASEDGGRSMSQGMRVEMERGKRNRFSPSLQKELSDNTFVLF